MISYFPVVTGSLTVSGSVNISGGITASGGITISGSIASASYAATASFIALAQSASNAVSAQTASYADALTVAGNLTAQTLVVQTITSSVDFVTGSTRFGSLLDNTHVFSGSVTMNPGGLFVSSSGRVGIGTTNPTSLLSVGGSSASTATPTAIQLDNSYQNSVGVTTALKFYLYKNGTETYGIGLNSVAGVEYHTAGYHGFYTATNGTGSERMRITNVGVGIGTTPNSGWGGSAAIQLASYASISSGDDGAKAFAVMGYNMYNSGTWTPRYLISSENATAYRQRAGEHQFFTAGTGTAGNTISFTQAMTITSAGNVGINTSDIVSTNLTGAVTIRKTYNGDTTNGATTQAYYSNQSALYLFGRNSGLSIISNNVEEGKIAFGNNSAAIYASIVTSTGNSSVGGDMYFKVGSDTERLRITTGGDLLIAGGNTSGQSAVSTCTALRFPNQYSNGYTDAGVKLFIFNSGATIQGFTAGPSYDLQYHSSGDNTNGKHVWYVGNVQVMRVQSTSGNVTILGSLSKGSGSFRIKHPLASKKNTHQLVHSFIEGPQADLIYSGGVTLVNGRAVINIDEAAIMTEGTFEALCRNIRVFTSNETSWDAVRGKVEGNILTIECQNTESTDEVSWLVIGERQDEHMFETEWTDSNGKVIVEPLIPADSGNLMSNNH